MHRTVNSKMLKKLVKAVTFILGLAGTVTLIGSAVLSAAGAFARHARIRAGRTDENIYMLRNKGKSGAVFITNQTPLKAAVNAVKNR